jgi:hypothetical protein
LSLKELSKKAGDQSEHNWVMRKWVTTLGWCGKGRLDGERKAG